MNSSPLTLKKPRGWFAAGAEIEKAMTILSDGAFKLFVYLCLNARRDTATLEISQTELARNLKKGQQTLRCYFREMQTAGICQSRFGRSPLGRGMIEINEAYWPYLKAAEDTDANGSSAYVRVPPLFWWEGPDGSRILCDYTPEYGSGLGAPRNWPSRNYLAMVMTGDNHGPPSAADVENLRQHYALTLRDWLDGFERAADKVRQMFDEEFVRAWRLYLAGSRAAFITGEMQLFQVLFTPRSNVDWPLTRAHLYAG